MKKTILATVAIAALGLGAQLQAESAEKIPPKHSHHDHAYLEFPPVNEDMNIEFHPEHYWANADYPYFFHEGYWWYPSSEGGFLEGYTPYFHEGSYWYPSMQHPHVVYITDDPVVYVYPHPMDKPMDDAIDSPMHKDHVNAPEVK